MISKGLISLPCQVCTQIDQRVRQNTQGLTLCDPIDGRPPGSPIPGILQARTLEWVAISFSNALRRQCGVSHEV